MRSVLDNDLAKEILLENLSFYEWMNIENILISITPEDLVLIESLTLDELKSCIKELMKEKFVEEKKLDGELKYRRIHKKTLKSKVLSFLK